MMRAAFAHFYGPPDEVLSIGELACPVPTGNQVLVRIHAASLNPIDLRMVQGYGSRVRRLAKKPEFPFVTGRDFVGEVVANGPKAKKFRPGQRVMGITDIKEIGSHCEYSAIAETSMALAPDGIASIELAAIPYVALTSWTALVSNLGLDPDNAQGEHLFVHAGSGGIGSLTVQWGRSMGMRVSTTCGPDNVEWVKQLGADRVIDYKNEDYRKIVHDVDYAYDTLGGQFAADTAQLVKRGGGYASLVHPILPTLDRLGLVLGGLSVARQLIGHKITNGWAGRKFTWSTCKPNEKGIEHFATKVKTGEIKAVIDREFPLERINEGYAHLASGRTKGKVVIRIAE